MKKKTAMILASLHVAFPAVGDILYVNNDTAYPADYRTFDDAFAAAAAGDTIMLAASTTSYGNIVIEGKPVKVVGNKMRNSTAPSQPARADEGVTMVDWVSVGYLGNSDEVTEDRLLANGTIIESLSYTRLSVWSNSCTIRRCSAGSNTSFTSVYGSSNLFTGCSFWHIFLRRVVNFGVTPDHVAPSTSNHFRNCKFSRRTSLDSLIDAGAFTSASLHHCALGVSFGLVPKYEYVIDEDATLTMRNCILGDSSDGTVRLDFNKGSTRLHRCLILGSSGPDKIPSLSADLDNLVEPDRLVVFGDQFLNLAAGSPALGAGDDGEDIGIMGGPTPFRWGGSPALPLINKLNILEANPTTGLTFRVEAEARD